MPRAPRRLACLLGPAAATVALLACGEPVDLGPDPDVTLAAVPPPAISGGTMLVTRDGRTVAMADPDRDKVWIADVKAGVLLGHVALEPGDEPGRLVEDGAGRLHVALRRGGAVATIDLSTRALLDRRDVCPAPRGIAHDPASDHLHVACMGGELVTLPSAGGDAVRKLRFEADLRDVLVSGDELLVSRFRSAELLTVGPDGEIRSRRRALGSDVFGQTFAPSVAWRTTARPQGGAIMVHQRASANVVETMPDAYVSTPSCDGSIVQTTVTILRPPAKPGATEPALPLTAALPDAVLPVDVAVSPLTGRIAVVAAGSGTIIEIAPEDLESPGSGCSHAHSSRNVYGQPTAVAFDGEGRVLVQTREPARLIVRGGATIELGVESRKDTGHDMFHQSAGDRSALACASCHPEGRDDGHAWNFSGIGIRRTQNVSGGILDTAPLHWDGDLDDIESLMAEVFEGRMGARHQGPRRLKAFAGWIDALPRVAASPAVDEAKALRGEALFHDAKVACASCHSGPKGTNNQWADVGTGKAFQVPALVGLAARGPYMHDGCAETLRGRFTPGCGGGDAHGVTSHLTEAQLDDLVSFLETL